MKLTVAAVALCATGALSDLVKGPDHKDFFEQEVEIEGSKEVYYPDHYHHDHHDHHDHRPDNHDHHPDHHDHHPYGHRPYHPVKEKKLTQKFVCDRLNFFADEADSISNRVKNIDCGSGFEKCWDLVKKGIYELEFALDFFDTSIDKANLDVCWDCRQESRISLCYQNYAESLIYLVELLDKKTEYLEGDIAKYVVTVVNSLRSADYTFIYELVRRMSCEKYEKHIMKKQGALDGSTLGSIREAFCAFPQTPYITGDCFEGKCPKCEGPKCHKPKYNKCEGSKCHKPKYNKCEGPKCHEPKYNKCEGPKCHEPKYNKCEGPECHKPEIVETIKVAEEFVVGESEKYPRPHHYKGHGYGHP